MKFWLVLPLALICCACAKKDPVETKATGTSPGDVLKLTGPGGLVSIGDDLAAAKKAFPPPKGAQAHDGSASATIFTPEGWCWSDEAGEQAFEAATRSGKIVALIQTQSKADAHEPARTIALLGEPAKKAEGKHAKVYSWTKGNNARLWLSTSMPGPFNVGSLTFIGAKDDLKLLGYDADDPGAYVRQIDMSMAIKPVLDPVFEEAKRKAKQKAMERVKREVEENAAQK